MSDGSPARSPRGGRIDAGVFERIVAIRRDLHRHPELSGRERRTSDRVCDRLAELGISHRRLGETGVVADLPGGDDVARVALRADLDALPIQERTGLEFASEEEGVMHACAHDGHTAMLLGAAEVLSKGDLPAPVRLLFQPAEEIGTGARALLDAGALEGVGMIFAGHLDVEFRTGELAVTRGAVSASVDTFRIGIGGREGHAARPHEALDAVVVGSMLVMGLQTIVAREIDPAQPSVVTVGRFEAGRAANVIAGRAELEGTIRAHDPETRERLIAAVRRVAESTAKLHGAEFELELSRGAPVLMNRGEAYEIARAAAVAVVEESGVTRMKTSNMGGEDFGYFLERAPGCYIRFGARKEGSVGPPAHSGGFDFDEEALGIGAAWLVEVARRAGEALAERAS